MKISKIIFLAFVSIVLLLIIGWGITNIAIDDGIKKFPKDQQVEAREAFDIAMVNCLSNPLSRIFLIKTRLESFNINNNEAILRSYTFYAIPAQKITISSGGETICSK